MVFTRTRHAGRWLAAAPFLFVLAAPGVAHAQVKESILQLVDQLRSDYGDDLLLMAAAVVLLFLLLLLMIARAIPEHREKARERREQRAREEAARAAEEDRQLQGMLAKIENNDPEKVALAQRRLLDKALIFLIRRNNDQEFETDVDQTLDQLKEHGFHKRIHHKVERTREKSKPTDIRKHDQDLDAVQQKADRLNAFVEQLEAKARELIQQPNIRYSTVNTFVKKMEAEKSMIMAAADKLEQMHHTIDDSMEAIIARQDERLVEHIFTGAPAETGDDADEARRKKIDQLNEEVETAIDEIERLYRPQTEQAA
jgi:Na+-transporting methylmalonyl-CoA/oxaloacetate decarboxylase gamma subunit